MPCLAPLRAEALREHHHARLGGRVGRQAPGAGASGHGGHVDDLAGALPDHHATDGLRKEKDSGEVRLHHRVPFASGEVYERRADAVAGVVDQEVDATEGVERPGDDAVNVPRVGHVAREGQGATPLRAHDIGDRLQRGLAAAARHHVGSDLGQLDGDRAPDPLTRPCHDRHAVAERVG